ncbi:MULTISPECIES: hypothetical protein [unclassified Moraxella]|uniref:hypothetical protein n=1 Tax=unclassified Moraxella TaxID=2685852 RepID=UPI003AF4C4E1
MREHLFNHPLKNVILAVVMMLFLAISFKIGGDLSTDNPSVSQTDSVISTLNQPNQPVIPTTE